jgi:glycosyltransferase involved in cell wall biosynthesis
VRAQARTALTGSPQPNAFARSVRRTLRVTAQHTRHGNWTAYRDAEAIVVSDAHVGDTVRSHLLRRERTHVVPNGVDVHEYRPARAEDLRERWGVPLDAPLLLTLGRLARDKGNDVALHALASLPEPYLVIAGDGEERGPLERLAARLGVSDRVRLIGAVPQVEVPRAMAAADVFWFPTVRDEAAPLVLPQAMAAGLPVVASRIGGIPDYVSRPGEQAVLVVPGDATALAEATRPLLADPALRARMGAAARERVVEEFSLERMIERTVEVYRVAIARTARVPAAA